MVHTVTPAGLVEMLSTQNAPIDLIDVREPSEWDTGHIPGARLVPLAQFRADPEKVLVRGVTTVFICAKGVRSLAAAKLAERFGYDHLFNLEGGTKEWASTDHPLHVDAVRAAA